MPPAVPGPSPRRRPIVSAVLVALATGGLVAGCSSAPGAGRESPGATGEGQGPGTTGEGQGPGTTATVRPVQAAAPADPPSAHLSDGVCTVDRPVTTPASGGALVSVDPGPDTVTAVWLPGLNADPCTTAETEGDAAAADTLAAAVDASSAAPSGPMSCPADDGTGVELFFAYAGGAPTEEVDVSLTGCRAISAPGRSARDAGTAIVADLATIAPAAWKADLAGGRSPIGIGPGPASP